MTLFSFLLSFSFLFFPFCVAKIEKPGIDWCNADIVHDGPFFKPQATGDCISKHREQLVQQPMRCGLDCFLRETHK